MPIERKFTPDGLPKSDELMQVRREKPPNFGLDAICPPLFDFQGYLGAIGVRSYISGGVGVDLLGMKYLADFQPRSHKDVDLYIKIQKRGIVMEVLRRMGAEVDIPENRGIYLLRTQIGRIPYDFFSMSQSDKGISVPIPGKTEGEIKFVDVEGKDEWVVLNDRTFIVLDPRSQSRIQEAVEEKNQRDIEILRQVLKGKSEWP